MVRAASLHLEASPLRLDVQLGKHLRVRSWRQDKVRAGRGWPASAHGAVEISWIVSGGAVYWIGSERFELGPGDAMVVPEIWEHTTEILPDTTAGSLWVDASVVDDARLHLTASGSYQDSRG